MEPWGFELKDIPLQRVLIVHDPADSVVPAAASRYAHKQMPKSLLKKARGGGHLFLYRDVERVLIALTGGRPWYEALAPTDRAAAVATSYDPSSNSTSAASNKVR